MAKTRTEGRLAEYSLTYLASRLLRISMAFDGFLPSTGTRTATSEWVTSPLSQGPGGEVSGLCVRDRVGAP